MLFGNNYRDSCTLNFANAFATTLEEKKVIFICVVILLPFANISYLNEKKSIQYPAGL